MRNPSSALLVDVPAESVGSVIEKLGPAQLGNGTYDAAGGASVLSLKSRGGLLVIAENFYRYAGEGYSIRQPDGYIL